MYVWSMSASFLGRSLPFLGLLQELLEALAGSEENAIEMQTIEPEVGGQAFLVSLADVEAEQKLPVAVVGQLADQPPHHLGLLVQQDGLKLARRGRHGLRELTRVAPGPLAGRLAPFGDEEVTGRAAKEGGEARRVGEASLAQPFDDDAKGFLLKVVGEVRQGAEAVQKIKEPPAIAFDEISLGVRVSRRNSPDEVGGDDRLVRLWSCIGAVDAHRASTRAKGPGRSCSRSPVNDVHHIAGSGACRQGRAHDGYLPRTLAQRWVGPVSLGGPPTPPSSATQVPPGPGILPAAPGPAWPPATVHVRCPVAELYVMRKGWLFIVNPESPAAVSWHDLAQSCGSVCACACVCTPAWPFFTTLTFPAVVNS